jgi:hypothetical protein
VQIAGFVLPAVLQRRNWSKLDLHQDALPISLDSLPLMEEPEMKFLLALPALLILGFVDAGTKPAHAVIYCTYVGYPVGCVARAGVVLRPRPVARAALVTPGRPMNRGGPVNRVGRR